MAKKKPETAPAVAPADQTGTQPSETAAETQQIKFLRSHPGYAYWPGDTANLTTEHVTLLVDGKFAELVTEADPTDETDE